MPKGYRQQVPQAPVQEQVTEPVQTIEEPQSAEVIATDSGLIEQELPLDATGVPEEIIKEEVPSKPDTQTVNVSSTNEISQLLETQLNAKLQGAPKLIKAEKIDTVVIREENAVEEVISDGGSTVVYSESGLIEEDILETEVKETPKVQKKESPAAPPQADPDDSSYSSKELIERIYESTQEDWDKTPSEGTQKDVSGEKGVAKRGEVTKPRAASASYDERGAYTVQVASFKDPRAARNLAQNLERKGYKVSVSETEIPGKGKWSRVRVGQFETKEEARLYGQRLKREEPEVNSVFVTTIK